MNNAVLRSAKSPAAATAGHRPGELKVRWLGRPGSYVPIWRAMQEFTDRRDEHCADELWMVEHRPVFTLGQAGSHAHVLAPGAIPVVHVDRGGQVTYHGPGQVVLYPLLDLRRARIGIKSLVHRLEESVIQLLREYGINGERRIGAPGVYTDACKIAALGLRVRRGCSLHGLALNVSMDLEPFSRINPCGYQGLQVTQIADHGGPREWDTVAADLVTQFAHSLHLNVTPSDPPRIAGHDHP